MSGEKQILGKAEASFGRSGRKKKGSLGKKHLSWSLSEGDGRAAEEVVQVERNNVNNPGGRKSCSGAGEQLLVHLSEGAGALRGLQRVSIHS